MTLATHEFIRRFLMHVLPAGFHRIRYYGLLASGKRAENIARARELLTLPIIPVDAIKAANTNADRAANARASLPLLRRPHDHHRAVRTRRNPALSPKPANASDQDRHLMIMSIRSPSLNAGRFCRRRSAEHVLGSHKFFARQQITARSLASLAPKRSSRTRTACFAPRNRSTSRLALRTHAARSPLKSP